MMPARKKKKSGRKAPRAWRQCRRLPRDSCKGEPRENRRNPARRLRDLQRSEVGGSVARSTFSETEGLGTRGRAEHRKANRLFQRTRLATIGSGTWVLVTDVVRTSASAQ